MQGQMSLGTQIIEQVWQRLRPYELPKLREMPAERIAVVRGSYDHVEKILKNASIPHTAISSFPKKGELQQGGKYQDCKVLFVNCDSEYHDKTSDGFEDKGLTKNNKSSIIDFVESGGRIITTDWAQEVVKYLFGKISSKQDVIPEKVVEVKFPSYIGKNLLGINYANAQPKWWIEASSDTIKPLANSGIVELITSNELQKAHSSKYIAIGFKQGQGEAFHFVSHLIAQKFKNSTARDKQGLQTFLDQTQTKISGSENMANVTLGGIETTYTLMNTVLELIREKPILEAKK